MKKVTIAESMAEIRQKLDAIDYQQEQPAQSSVSPFQAHMNTIQSEYLAEGAGWDMFRNFGRGVIGKPAIGSRLPDVPKTVNPDGSITGGYKRWGVPSQDATDVNKSGRTTRNVVGVLGLPAIGWALNDYVDALNGKVKPDPNGKEDGKQDYKYDNKKKPDGSIQALQHLLNIKYNANVPEDGIWTPEFQAKFDELTATKKPKKPTNNNTNQNTGTNDQDVTSKVEKEPVAPKGKDEKQSNQLRTDQIQGGLNNQQPNGQNTQQAPVTPTAPVAPPATQELPNRDQTDMNQLNTMMQQLRDLVQQMSVDPETADEMKKY